VWGLAEAVFVVDSSFVGDGNNSVSQGQSHDSGQKMEEDGSSVETIFVIIGESDT